MVETSGIEPLTSYISSKHPKLLNYASVQPNVIILHKSRLAIIFLELTYSVLYNYSTVIFGFFSFTYLHFALKYGIIIKI